MRTSSCGSVHTMVSSTPSSNRKFVTYPRLTFPSRWSFPHTNIDFHLRQKALRSQHQHKNLRLSGPQPPYSISWNLNPTSHPQYSETQNLTPLLPPHARMFQSVTRPPNYIWKCKMQPCIHLLPISAELVRCLVNFCWWLTGWVSVLLHTDLLQWDLDIGSCQYHMLYY